MRQQFYPNPPIHLPANPPMFTPNLPPDPPKQTVLPDDPVPGGDNSDEVMFQEGTASGVVNALGNTNPQNTSTSHPKRNNVGAYKDGPTIIQWCPSTVNHMIFHFPTPL